MAAVSQGEVLPWWFREVQTRFFSVAAESEATGEGNIVSRASVVADVDSPSFRISQPGQNCNNFEVQLAKYPWWAELDYVTRDVTLGWAGSVQSAYEAYGNAVVGLPWVQKFAGSAYSALDEVNPASRRIEQDLSFKRANLDIALHCRLRRSLRESRYFLRGYA
ncbi:hypothetical protein [Streptomyces sp. NPDC000878]